MTEDTAGAGWREIESGLVGINLGVDPPGWGPGQRDHAVKRAMELYHNRKLARAAARLAASHPRAIDYIEQAPVLVMFVHGNTYPRKEMGKRKASDLFAHYVDRGLRLNALLRSYEVSPPLRALKGRALIPDRWSAIKGLCSIPESTLAQSMPRAMSSQTMWLRGIDDWICRMRHHLHMTRGWDSFVIDWIAPALGALRGNTLAEAARSSGDLADFFHAEGSDFNRRWTFKQAHEACARWHETLMEGGRPATEFVAKYGVAPDREFDYAPLPDHHVIGELEFVALRSGTALFEEGRAMHHCVVDYTPYVHANRSRIYSIRERGDGTRIATLELVARGHDWIVNQIKGAGNAEPASLIKTTATIFSGYCSELQGKR